MSASVEAGFELRGESSSLRVLVRDLWRARVLIRTLARKDFFVRFRRASFGMLWAIGLPLIQGLVMAIIFSRITNFHSGVKLPVFVLWGVLPWTFFSTTLQSASGAVVDGSNLATKTYFPRAVLPLVSVLSNFRGFLPAVVVMIGIAAAYRVHLGTALLLLAPATVLFLLMAASFSLVLAALHVYFRDTKFIVSAAILPWFWASGVVYPLSALGSWSKWLRYNPAVGMLEMFRAAIGVAAPGWGSSVLISLAWIVGLLLVAALQYRRYDRVFVDLL
jgi:ABC-type polysaccharide/polyol phosphate export permease